MKDEPALAMFQHAVRTNGRVKGHPQSSISSAAMEFSGAANSLDLPVDEPGVAPEYVLTDTLVQDGMLSSLSDETVNILMVDDQTKNLFALEAILENLGENLVRASSGSEALQWLRNHRAAVVLLDVLMPVMDGYETAALIRESEEAGGTPIIFLTAIGESDVHMFRGYSVGAVDYMFKPLNSVVLKSKVKVFVDLFKRTEESKRQGSLLRELERREQERRLLEAERKWKAERLHLEVELARQIQQKLFPASPPACSGFDIFGTSLPAEATGGDFFDYIPMLNNDIGIVIADVTGHGLGPALLMSATRAYLRALALTYPAVARILTLASPALTADLGYDRLVTLIFARLDPQSRSLRYCNAGHPPAFILDSAGTVRAKLGTTAMPLGVDADQRFSDEEEVILDPGDLVLFLTDGVTEALSPTGDFFGIERALAVVRAHRHRAAREIVEALAVAVEEFVHFQPQRDDMTAIIVKVNGR